MKAVIQRVAKAKVNLKNDTTQSNEIGRGILVLLGVEKQDTEKEADYLLDKIINLRIFEDNSGKMNLSLIDLAGDLMVVSQFTLLADTKKGRRPSFVNAGDPEKSAQLVEKFIQKAKDKLKNVQSGWFGKHMEVTLVNDGPVTLILDSK